MCVKHLVHLIQRTDVAHAYAPRLSEEERNILALLKYVELLLNTEDW